MKFPRATSPNAWPVSDHCDGRVFFNPEPVDHNLRDFLYWRRTRQPEPWQRITDFTPAPAPPKRVDSMRITWVNHASVLIQCAGLNVLTDPIWSKWAAPLPGLGVQRFHPPGIRFDDLPPIDTVLINHAHYDHLDHPTVRRLIKAHNPAFVVPLGLTAWFSRHGAQQVTALDWWQKLALSPQLAVHATPARHWTSRAVIDQNQSLWCGYYLETPDGGIYFAGDTGMTRYFATIRQHLGAPRIALLPIGAYEPRWFMQQQHMNPAEAVTAHQMLEAGRSIAIHFGTFNLADEGQHEPERALASARQQADVPADRFVVPAFGASVVRP